MTTWVGTWFSVTLRNEGLFVNGVGLTNDRQSAKGYLNISGWDPNTNVLDATLSYIDPTNGQPVSVPLPLNVISGGVHKFRVWAHVTAGDVIYGFSALQRDDEWWRCFLGSLKTIGGYHARVSTDEGGWLRITGKVTPEAKYRQLSTSRDLLQGPQHIREGRISFSGYASFNSSPLKNKEENSLAGETPADASAEKISPVVRRGFRVHDWI